MDSTQTTVPYGHCHCGCGQKTRIADRDHKKSGHVKGEPVRFVFGHHFRLPRIEQRWREEDRGYGTPCWIGLTAANAAGYTVDGKKKRSRLMHVNLWENRNGPVPAGLELDHLCRVRRCVNPAHLEPVTSAENTRRGANAKLTYESAAEVRRLYGEGGWTHRSLAARFGVSHNVIGYVLRGKAWT